MVRRSYKSGKTEKCENKRIKNQTEPEKKLLVLEFFIGQEGARTSNWIRDHQIKFNKNTSDTMTALLDAMCDDKLLERTVSTNSADRQEVLYDISSTGRKAVETIKKLTDENDPLVKLGFFRCLLD